MVNVSALLCLLASAVLSASSEPLASSATPDGMVNYLAPEEPQAPSGIVEVVATISDVVHGAARTLREAGSGPNRPRARPRNRPRSRPNHSPSHTRALREAEPGPNRRPRNRPRNRPRSRPNREPNHEPNHSPSHTRDLLRGSEMSDEGKVAEAEAAVVVVEDENEGRETAEIPQGE